MALTVELFYASVWELVSDNLSWAVQETRS